MVSPVPVAAGLVLFGLLVHTATRMSTPSEQAVAPASLDGVHQELSLLKQELNTYFKRVNEKDPQAPVQSSSREASGVERLKLPKGVRVCDQLMFFLHF